MKRSGASVNLRLFRAARKRYLKDMTLGRHLSLRPALLWGLGATSVGLLAGLGLASWSEHGVAIFLAMAETGLSWCF